jgi:hypothetical protein
MSLYFYRYSEPIVEFYPSGVYKTYEFYVPWIDEYTKGILSKFVPYGLDYWESGAYLYGPFRHISGVCSLDTWYELFGESKMAPELKAWLEAVCRRVIPAIKRLNYASIGKTFIIV